MNATPILDFNEQTGRYELSLTAEDLKAVYEALKAHAEREPDSIAAFVAYTLEDEGVEEDLAREQV